VLSVTVALAWPSARWTVPASQPTRLRRGCENALMRSTEQSSIQSIGSPGAIYAIGSPGSILSIGSTGSILSIGSTGSILSIGSAGSILSIGSAGSILSILSFGSVGSILSALSRWSMLAWRGDSWRPAAPLDTKPTPELAGPEEDQSPEEDQITA